MIQIVIRSSLFAAFQLLLTPVFAVIALLTFPLPALTRYRIITVWTCWVMWASRVICGIRYRVIGAENIPQQPCIILAKHQSAWETMGFQLIFPPQVWVLKKELRSVLSGGIEDLLSPEWRGESKNAVLFWNLILSFMRYRFPFTFLLQGSFSSSLIAPTPDADDGDNPGM